MRTTSWVILTLSVAGTLVWAADWPSAGGNPQRDGWSRGDKKFSTASTGRIELLYKHKFENPGKGPDTLGSPIILSNLISYKGFKELLFIGGSSDTVYAVDADLSKPYFTTHFDTSASPAATATCPGGMTASVVMPGSSAANGRGGPPPAGRAGAAVGRGPAAPPAPGRAGGGAGGGRGSANLYAVSSDGRLRTLRRQDGNAEAFPPLEFLPANARATGLNIAGTTLYAATVSNCGGNPNALYSISTDPAADHKVTAFLTKGTGFSGTGGVAVAADGTAFGAIADGTGDVAGKYSDTVVALTPALTVKDYFTPTGTLPPLKADAENTGITPAIFDWNGKTLVVAGSRDGRIFLLDAAAPGGTDHHTPLAVSDVVPGAPFHGTFSTWEDAANNNARWIYAATSGAIIAFKVEDKAGQPTLVRQWTSAAMNAPAAPATASGLVFALSTGRTGNRAAVLSILDAATGKELYSGKGATAPATSGLAVANARVYFATRDNTLYCYGIPLEH